MSNTIGWGKGASNNSIGWGNVGTNGFGSIYSSSNSGETDLAAADNPNFIIEVDTSIAGVSNSDQFQFTGAVGEYDVEAYQNDSLIASFSDLVNEQTITLPSSGVYELRVIPKEVNGFNRISFNQTGDRLKLIEIRNWGNVVWSSLEGAFRGCENMVGTYIDVPNLSSVTSMLNCFRFCILFNSPVNNWDVSSVINFQSAFENAQSFNQPLNNWNTQNAQSMFSMFRLALSFKQDISDWNVENVGTGLFLQLNNFLQNIDINESGTTSNYDNLLNSWSNQNVQPNLSFNGGNSKYSADGEVGRNILINTYNWTITDGGLEI